MGIEISIKAGADEASSSVRASGCSQHIISDEEKKTFGLSNSGLKNAVGKYFGKNPNDAFLHSPTPWNDLYKTYGWKQVGTILDVQSAAITEITSEPVIIATKKFHNNSSKKATYNAGISDEVTNTTESNWSTSNTVSFQQMIKYDVSFLGTGGGGETTMSYNHTWGEGGSQSKNIAVGSDSGVSVELDPGESVEAQLSASRGVMKVRVVYKVYLTGSTAINYNPTFKGHHFWALPINNVMQSAGLKTALQFTEDIEVGYYSNSTIEIRDSHGKLKTSFLADDTPGVLSGTL